MTVATISGPTAWMHPERNAEVEEARELSVLDRAMMRHSWAAEFKSRYGREPDFFDEVFGMPI